MLQCTGCSWLSGPYKPRKKAIQEGYIRYQTDASYRRKIDDEWRRVEAMPLEKDLPPPIHLHRYGPVYLRKFGIEPIRGLSPDDR